LYRHRSELEARSRSTPDATPEGRVGTTSVSGSPTLVESTAGAELGP
jgi:hypothetical protein